MKKFLGQMLMSAAFGPFLLCGGMLLLAHILMDPGPKDNR